MISLNKISVEYQAGLVALQPTTLDFKKGKFTVLLGSSGAGKSSLLRCINALVRPTTGSIGVPEIGDPLASFSALRRHRRNTAMIFQQHQLIGRLSVLQNVLVGRLGFHSTLRSLLPLPRADKHFALECLDRVGLFDKALQRVDNLSGGQQQRVGIARGLVQRPKIMLADEPVASLDPASSHRVLSLLRRVCKEDGLTAVVSLHQLEFAKEYADRIVALAEGHVIFDGTPPQLDDEICHQIYSADASGKLRILNSKTGVADESDDAVPEAAGSY